MTTKAATVTAAAASALAAAALLLMPGEAPDGPVAQPPPAVESVDWSRVEATVVGHYVERKSQGNRHRATIHSAPIGYRRDGKGPWLRTRERFRLDGGRYLADEGIHSVAVDPDGTITATHNGKAITLRLRGLTTLSAGGKESVAEAIDLSTWKLDATEADAGKLSWSNAGSTYSVWFFADGFRDAYTPAATAKAAVAAKATVARFGLAFDCAMPDGEAAEFDTESIIEIPRGKGKVRFRPAAIEDTRDAALSLDKRRVHREKWKLAKGRLLQTLPADALDGVEELHTEVVYDDGDHLTADNWLHSGNVNYHYGTYAELYVGAYGGTYRAMVLFDLSDLGSVSAVNSATLELYQSYNTGTSSGDTARILAGAWGQTTSANNAAGYPCWAYRLYNTNAWNTAGCAGVGTDRTAVTGTPTSFPAHSAWRSFNVQAWVEDWLVDGDPNYGFLVVETGTGTAHFWSLDYTTDSTLRPKLTIDYTAGGGFVPFPNPILDRLRGGLHGGFQ